MSVSFNKLPHDILSFVVSYFKEDPHVLCSLLRTTRSLRPHAEYFLYRTVDFTAAISPSWNIRFLKSITLHPRLGSIVTCFHPYTIEYHRPFKPSGEYVDLLIDAMKFMPNIKSLRLIQDLYEMPRVLRWDSESHAPFQLDRTEVRLERQNYPLGPKLGGWDPQRFEWDLLQFLRHQHTLRHFSLILELDDIGTSDRVTTKVDSEQWREACSSLQVLEGRNRTIRLVLPHTQRVKALFWEYDRSYREPLRSPGDLDTDNVLKEDFFTPGHCEAYRRLEHLVLSRQISLLPVLSTFLSSLKTLLMTIKVSPLGASDSDSDRWEEEGSFMRAIGGLTELVMLVIIQDCSDDLKLDYQRIFATCRKLQRLAIWEGEDGHLSLGPVSMERGRDGVIRRIDWSFESEETPKMPYVGAGWFNFGTED